MRALATLFYFWSVCLCGFAIWALAMQTAFSGLRPTSFAYVAPTISEIISIALLAFGGIAINSKTIYPKYLLLTGPIFSLLLSLVLGYMSFSVAPLFLVLPEVICCSIVILLIGRLKYRGKEV